jgi:hypothetical protein
MFYIRLEEHHENTTGESLANPYFILPPKIKIVYLPNGKAKND